MTLDARLQSRGSLRFTPAGVPALDFELAHESTQVEAGSERRVACELAAVALGGAAVTGGRGVFLGTVAGDAAGWHASSPRSRWVRWQGKSPTSRQARRSAAPAFLLAATAPASPWRCT